MKNSDNWNGVFNLSVSLATILWCIVAIVGESASKATLFLLAMLASLSILVCLFALNRRQQLRRRGQ